MTTLKLTPEERLRLIRAGVIKSIAPPLNEARVDSIVSAKRDPLSPARTRPYITRMARDGICSKCGQPAQEYTPGNFSVWCQACNEERGRQRRKA